MPFHQVPLRLDQNLQDTAKQWHIDLFMVSVFILQLLQTLVSAYLKLLQLHLVPTY